MVARRTTNRQTNRQNRGVVNQRRNPGVRSVVQKAGQRALRSGSHPQQSWRGGTTGARKKLTSPGAQLGPMGELGDDVIFELTLKESVLESYRGNGAPKRIFNPTALWRRVMDEIYDPFQAYMDKWIDLRVPSDTGDLRKSLHSSITQTGGSSIQKFPFQVVLNTRRIPYAGPVNNMPTAWLRHPGRHGANTKGKRRRVLNDPDAQKGWYNLLLLGGRNTAKVLISRFLKSVAADLPQTFQLPQSRRTRFNYIQSLFRVRLK